MLLVMQSGPQFILAYYVIGRADAIVAPINPMSVATALEHYVADCGARAAIVAPEVYPQLQPLLGRGLDHAIIAAYSDDGRLPTDLPLAAAVSAPRQSISDPGVMLWSDALGQELRPIQEACVIATQDAYRGETLKAVVVLRASHKGAVSESNIIEWTRQHLAAYSIRAASSPWRHCRNRRPARCNGVPCRKPRAGRGWQQAQPDAGH